MSAGAATDQRALLEQAIRQLRETRARLAQAEARCHEPIAVVGAGVRTPGGATSLDGFWDLLCAGTDAVAPLVTARDCVEGRRGGGDPPADAGWAGLLPGIDGFDTEFFGIPASEADHLDPQQRLVLETAWEAAEDAGIPVDRLRGEAAGVFLGIYGTDYLMLQSSGRAEVTAYTAPGAAHSMAANRLSYLLDLRGPSLAVDTACSSSLVAVHLACRALRAGDCDFAFVGGVNVIADPVSTLVTQKVLPFASGGRCRTFDADADGIVRGEGAAVLLLERLSDARGAGRRVRGVIKGTAVNHNGRTNGLTAPSPRAQVELIRHALADAAVDPGEVSYVEAHGTGTNLGDPIEVEALREVYGAGPAPCALGSVKTNFGHQEAAAGITGLVKAMLVLENGQVPPHLHLRELNPEIDLAGSRFSVPTAVTRLPPDAPRLAAVSSFGFGGANAHVILEGPPQVEPLGESAGKPERLLLPISARSEGALRELASQYAQRVARHDVEEAARICTGAACSRTHHRQFRVCVSAADQADLVRGLRDASDTARRRPVRAHRVGFVFTGQGSQWAGMGREILQSEPVVRAEVEACDAVVQDLAGWSPYRELLASAEHSRMQETEIAQVSIGALQLGLAALWRSWGVEPAAVVGHSMGEIVAACVSGALTREQALELLVRRAELTERGARGGAMASIGLPAEQVEELVRAAGADDIGIGAVNGPRSTVVSGGADSVRDLMAAAALCGARTRQLPVAYAFHSPMLEGCDRELAAAVAGVTARRPDTALYSTVTGAAVAPGQLDGAHWGRNLREKVLFRQAVEAMAHAGINAFVEVGPHPVLLRDIGETMEDVGVEHFAAATLRRDRPALTVLHQTLGALYEAGVDPRWESVFPGERTPVSLPGYPWQRSRHWLSLTAGEPQPPAAPRPGTGDAAGPQPGTDPSAQGPSRELVLAFVRERLADVLHLADTAAIGDDVPLPTLALDSLMIVELKNRIERRFGVTVPLRVLLEGATPAGLAQAVAELAARATEGAAV